MIRLSPAGLVVTAILLAACSVTPVPAATTAPSSAPAMASLRSAHAPESGLPELISDRSFERPLQPRMDAAYRTGLVTDHCVDRDLPAPPVAEQALVVLDRTYALTASYVPNDLVTASEAGLSGTSGTKLVRAALLDDLAAMAAAWDAAGFTILIDSGYRSYAAQAATFGSWVARLGYVEALNRSARAGHSEHQLGTTLDLSSPGWGGRFGDWAVEAPEGAWMAAHGSEYGFVMSYPAGSQGDTCFSYEPWHYRWIGREAAAAHRASGLDLRRFLVRYAGR